MKKKDKTPHSNIASEVLPNKACNYEDYLDMFSFKRKPVPLAFLLEIAQKVIKWAQEEESLKMDQFLIKYGIEQSDMDRWRDRCPELKDAWKFAKMIIGTRRELGALTGKLDRSIVAFTMPVYCREWKEQAEWRAKLKQTETESTGPQFVVLEKYPDTVEVPSKKVKE